MSSQTHQDQKQLRSLQNENPQSQKQPVAFTFQGFESSQLFDQAIQSPTNKFPLKEKDPSSYSPKKILQADINNNKDSSKIEGNNQRLYLKGLQSQGIPSDQIVVGNQLTLRAGQEAQILRSIRLHSRDQQIQRNYQSPTGIQSFTNIPFGRLNFQGIEIQQTRKISQNDPNIQRLSKPKFIQKAQKFEDQINDPEYLKKKLDDLMSETLQKEKLLEQLKLERDSNIEKKDYLQKADQTALNALGLYNKSLMSEQDQETQAPYSSLQNTLGVFSSRNLKLKRQSSLSCFTAQPHNPQKNFEPFMSLRVSLNNHSITELDQRMSELIQLKQETDFNAEKEELDNESLKHMKEELTLQKLSDYAKLSQLKPNYDDMTQIMESLELAKTVNLTRVKTALSGLVKCREDVEFFKLNKQERLLEKRLELQDQEAQKRQIKEEMQMKQSRLEEVKKRLSLLKKQNQSIKLDEIIVKFFEKRNHEESLLNKLQMVHDLEVFLFERKKSNDFAFENDIKNVQSFTNLQKSLNIEQEFLEKLMSSKVSQIKLKITQNLFGQGGFGLTKGNFERKESIASISQAQLLQSSVMIHKSSNNNPSVHLNSQSSTHNGNQLNSTFTREQRDKDRETERLGQEQTLSIQVRWESLRHKVSQVKETIIIQQYEEVMIKNQLLNVSFDEWQAEKSKRTLLKETLQAELEKYKLEIVSSQKLMSEENQAIESVTELKFLYEYSIKNAQMKQMNKNIQDFRMKTSQFLSDLMIKVTIKFDKIKQTVPDNALRQIQRVVNKYLGYEEVEETPQNNLLGVKFNPKNLMRRGSRRASFVRKPTNYDDNQTFQKMAELSKFAANATPKNQGKQLNPQKESPDVQIPNQMNLSAIKIGVANLNSNTLEAQKTFQQQLSPQNLRANAHPSPVKQNTLKQDFQSAKKSGQLSGSQTRKYVNTRKKYHVDLLSFQEENRLTMKLQRSLKYTLNSIMNIENAKIVVQGLKELTEDLLSQAARPSLFISIENYDSNSSGEMDNSMTSDKQEDEDNSKFFKGLKKQKTNLREKERTSLFSRKDSLLSSQSLKNLTEKHKFIQRDISYNTFKKEYNKSLGIFDLQIRPSLLLTQNQKFIPQKLGSKPGQELLQNQDQRLSSAQPVQTGSGIGNQLTNDLLLSERPKKIQKVKIDEVQLEESFVHNQYSKLKEERAKLMSEEYQQKILQAKQRAERLALQSKLQNSYLKKSSHSVYNIESQKLKDVNKQLVDFRLGEQKFINKFVKECDDASLKLNRFLAAVLPAPDESESEISVSKPLKFKLSPEKRPATQSKNSESSFNSLQPKSISNPQLSSANKNMQMQHKSIAKSHSSQQLWRGPGSQIYQGLINIEPKKSQFHRKSQPQMSSEIKNLSKQSSNSIGNNRSVQEEESIILFSDDRNYRDRNSATQGHEQRSKVQRKDTDSSYKNIGIQRGKDIQKGRKIFRNFRRDAAQNQNHIFKENSPIIHEVDTEENESPLIRNIKKKDSFFYSRQISRQASVQGSRRPLSTNASQSINENQTLNPSAIQNAFSTTEHRKSVQQLYQTSPSRSSVSLNKVSRQKQRQSDKPPSKIMLLQDFTRNHTPKIYLSNETRPNKIFLNGEPAQQTNVSQFHPSGIQGLQESQIIKLDFHKIRNQQKHEEKQVMMNGLTLNDLIDRKNNEKFRQQLINDAQFTGVREIPQGSSFFEQQRNPSQKIKDDISDMPQDIETAIAHSQILFTSSSSKDLLKAIQQRAAKSRVAQVYSAKSTLSLLNPKSKI